MAMNSSVVADLTLEKKKEAISSKESRKNRKSNAAVLEAKALDAMEKDKWRVEVEKEYKQKDADREKTMSKRESDLARREAFLLQKEAELAKVQAKGKEEKSKEETERKVKKEREKESEERDNRKKEKKEKKKQKDERKPLVDKPKTGRWWTWNGRKKSETTTKEKKPLVLVHIAVPVVCVLSMAFSVVPLLPVPWYTYKSFGTTTTFSIAGEHFEGTTHSWSSQQHPHIRDFIITCWSMCCVGFIALLTASALALHIAVRGVTVVTKQRKVAVIGICLCAAVFLVTSMCVPIGLTSAFKDDYGALCVKPGPCYSLFGHTSTPTKTSWGLTTAWYLCTAAAVAAAAACVVSCFLRVYVPPQPNAKPSFLASLRFW
eukprot:TRINITY_DN1467_c0_g1_i2.p1 TRINITY_DN1467_c0_g1~~TRINITY_DN1467_c0_g1_i2.p1  ORF type:complete len:375 (-),score=88.69 TRINITY_DN1467_c0_g1_i2:794-1918(-)